MTISGEKGDDDPLRIAPLGAGATAKVAPTAGPDAAAGADAVDRVAETAIADPAEAVGGIPGTEGIVEALASGAIDPAEAKAQLIDKVVEAHLPEGLDPAAAAEIRAEVEALLEGDALLSQLLRPAG